MKFEKKNIRIRNQLLRNAQTTNFDVNRSIHFYRNRKITLVKPSPLKCHLNRVNLILHFDVPDEQT